MRGKRHLADTFRWSPGEGADRVAMLSVGLGMAVPILLATSAGRLPLGMVATFGAFLVGNVRIGRNLTDQLQALSGIYAAVLGAVIAAALIAGESWWADVGMIVLACLAALTGGYSRPMAVASGRFIVFLIMVFNLMEASPHRGGLLVLIALGALWTGALVLAFGSAFRAAGWISIAPPPAAPATAATWKFRRLVQTLKSLPGWQYPLRLALCLGAASMIGWYWPHHHFHWIALTVTLLCHRQLEALPVKVTQRALGATLGVAATGLLVSQTLEPWILVCIIGVLASLGPWLRVRNYLAYTASMTPLIILLFDAGRPVELAILVDRLAATLIGAALVIAANMLFAKLVASKMQPA
ncbi:MAG: FUSC family protein [Parvibaculaceae bacterium]|nr:FUSC family protein [Parvibaculaceae bacterium]